MTSWPSCSISRAAHSESPDASSSTRAQSRGSASASVLGVVRTRNSRSKLPSSSCTQICEWPLCRSIPTYSTGWPPLRPLDRELLLWSPSGHHDRGGQPFHPIQSSESVPRENGRPPIQDPL